MKEVRGNASTSETMPTGTSRDETHSYFQHGSRSLCNGNGNDNTPPLILTQQEDATETATCDPAANSSLVVLLLSHSQYRVLFGLMGMGVLFPYNALITCVDYFSALHPDSRNIAGGLAVTCISALLVTTLLLLPLSTRDAGFHHQPLNSFSARDAAFSRTKHIFFRVTSTLTAFFSSPTKRIVLGYLVIILLLILLTVLPLSLPTLNAVSFLIGAADATAQSGLYVFAASYHQPSYTVAVTLGSAVSGLAVSALRLLTRGLFDTTTLRGLKRGTSLLFILSALVVLICIAAFYIVHDRPPPSPTPPTTNICTTTDNHLIQNGEGQDSVIQANNHNNRSHFQQTILTKSQSKYGHELIAVDNVDNDDSIPALTRKPRTLVDDDNMMTDDRFDNNSGLDPGEEIVTVVHSPSSARFTCRNCPPTDNHRLAIYFDTIQITWKPMLSAFLNFFITLSLFPGTVTAIKSTPDANRWIQFGEWLPVILIATFNAADCAGRALLGSELWPASTALLFRPNYYWPMVHRESLPGHIQLPNYNQMVWYQTLARAVFYPLFAMCLLPISPHPMITSDLSRCFIVFVFGATSGFVQSANFMAAPTMVQGEKYRDATSLLLLVSIYLGLTCGAYFGLLVDYFLQYFIKSNKS